MTPPPSAAPIETGPYDAGFFDAQRDISLRSAERIVPFVLSLVPARSVVDVGCGVGTWLSAFRAHDVPEVLGLDGPYVDPDRLLIPPTAFRSCDLESDWALGRRFDLAVSLEVAEHLSASAAAGFVARLCEAADVVLFSAALPHQGGTHHVNEQWPSYWIERFARHGLQPVDGIRRRFWRDPDVDLCYRNNALIFAHPRALEANPELSRLARGSAEAVPDVVHPERYEMLVTWSRPENLSLRTLARALPAAFGRAVRRRLGGGSA